ncbi:uncharacterized protein LOC106024457 [Esox lucius]|uniref:lysozyme n=1 Tax=Esox lucius TaxID=8010 RepID=A0A6Q2YC61_ESOLU|nr:uncharacterized protein LOC106024457 [Esox lucius]
MKLELLVVLVVAVLVPSLAEGRLVSKCELKGLLDKAALILNMTEKAGKSNVTIENLIAKIVCHVEKATDFNTSVVTHWRYGDRQYHEGHHRGKRHVVEYHTSTPPANPKEHTTHPTSSRSTHPTSSHTTHPESHHMRGKRQVAGDHTSTPPAKHDNPTKRPTPPTRATLPTRTIPHTSPKGPNGSLQDENHSTLHTTPAKHEDYTTHDAPPTPPAKHEDYTTHDAPPTPPAKHEDYTTHDAPPTPPAKHEDYTTHDAPPTPPAKHEDYTTHISTTDSPKVTKRVRRHAGHESNTKETVWTLYGLFQLSDHVICASGSIPSVNLCQMNCSALIDDNLSDDIECMETIGKTIESGHLEHSMVLMAMIKLLFPKECAMNTASKYFSNC